MTNKKGNDDADSPFGFAQGRLFGNDNQRSKGKGNSNSNGNGNGNDNRRSFDCVVRKVRERLRSG